MGQPSESQVPASELINVAKLNPGVIPLMQTSAERGVICATAVHAVDPPCG